MKFLSKFFVLVLASFFTFAIAGSAQAATTVSLGTANSFAVLAGSTITNTGSSVVTGDLGLSPGSAITGFFGTTANEGPGTVSGAVHQTDVTASTAQTALTAAYVDAAGRTPTTTYSPIHDLGGATLAPGVYNDPSSLGITGTLTLDAQGDVNAVWIFQAGSTLITASASKVSLINGAQSCNVFWQVGSSATLGTTTTFVGNILALESITLNTGATVDGRVLARNAAVTLDTNTIAASTCAIPSAAAAAAATTYTAAQTAATAAATAAAAAATPALPATGNGANDNSTSGYILLLSLAVSLTIISTVVVMKRKATSVR
jgi:hypothetical protein